MPLIDNPNTGSISDDMDFYWAAPELYEELYQRREALYEEAFKKHMGGFYGDVPLPTQEELMKQLDNQLARKKKLISMRAPETIIEYEDEKIVEIYRKLKQKEYAEPWDQRAAEYRTAYYERKEEFRNSPETKALLREIYDYNVSEWEKVKQTFV